MKAYFSVYKIDVLYIWNEIMKKNEGDEIDLMVVSDKILDIIDSKVKSNNSRGERLSTQNDNEFLYSFYKSSHPGWQGVVNKVISPDKRIKRENISNSFVMLSIVNEAIYASTGGSGSAYVNGLIIKSFGVSMIPRIFEGDEPVIKQFSENKMHGKRHSNTAVNRDFTNFISERDFNNIFKSINSTLSNEIMKAFGFENDEDDDKSFNLITTDAFNIRKQLTIDEYRILLNKIDDIWSEKPKFPLNYFVPSNSIGVNNTNAYEKMKEVLINDESLLNDIMVIGNSYMDYISADSWTLHTNKGGDKVCEGPITFSNILIQYQELHPGKLYKSSLDRIFKEWKISVGLNEENIIDEEKIIDLIDFSFTSSVEIKVPIIEVADVNDEIKVSDTFYLSSGNWYILNQSYNEFINDEFEEIYNASNDLQRIYKKYDLIRKDQSKNETEYNKSFMPDKKTVPNVICADQVYIDFVEICDLIVIDNDDIYLICNKPEPSGAGSRDLLNQVEASANIVRNDPESLNGYYDKLVNKGLNITKKDFLDKMKKPIYVASYVVEKLKLESKSLYAKLLSIQTKKSLSEHGFEFYVTSPRHFDED